MGSLESCIEALHLKNANKNITMYHGSLQANLFMGGQNCGPLIQTPTFDQHLLIMLGLV